MKVSTHLYSVPRMRRLCQDSSLSRSFTTDGTLALSFSEVKSCRLTSHVRLERDVAVNITVYCDVTLGSLVES
jgi:hypothetical protein